VFGKDRRRTERDEMMADLTHKETMRRLKSEAKIKLRYIRHLHVNDIPMYDVLGDPVLMCPYCKRVGTYDYFDVLGCKGQRMICNGCHREINTKNTVKGSQT